MESFDKVISVIVPVICVLYVFGQMVRHGYKADHAATLESEHYNGLSARLFMLLFAMIMFFMTTWADIKRLSDKLDNKPAATETAVK